MGILKTMMESFNAERHDAAFESFVLDAVENRSYRNTMLEACGDPDCDNDEVDANDEHMEKLLSAIPETDIDEDDELIREGAVMGVDEKGETKKMTLEECLDAYIPETTWSEEVA